MQHSNFIIISINFIKLFKIKNLKVTVLKVNLLQLSENMIADEISVISVQDINNDEETEETKEMSNKLNLEDLWKALCISIFGIVGISVLFAIPWTTIPRTDSIIYQSHWMEVLLPSVSNVILNNGIRILRLSIWTKEEALMSVWIYLRLFLSDQIIWTLLYISSYVIWSIYLQFNHPLPQLGLILLPTWAIMAISLWIVLPSNLLENKNFRQKLKLYMLFPTWVTMSVILREILSYLFDSFPPSFQFLVPFLVAGCREFDKRLLSKLVTKMMGAQDEAATTLVTILMSSSYSFLIAVRLVGSTYATICSAVAIDFCIHLKSTLQIIKEFRRVKDEGNENENTQKNPKLTILIIVELIEGFTPIIYMICIAMAYYGPNAHLFSNIGSSYWGTNIENFRSLIATMALLFAIDTLSIFINAFCIWKAISINILPDFPRIIIKYGLYMSITFASNINLYLASTDINLGMDQTQSFQWITSEGWRNLVNTSNILNNGEKADLLATAILHQ